MTPVRNSMDLEIFMLSDLRSTKKYKYYTFSPYVESRFKLTQTHLCQGQP